MLLVKEGSRRKSGHKVKTGILRSWRALSLSVGLLSCGLPVLAKAPAVMQSPTTDKSAASVPDDGSGSINGTVVDESGAVIVGARVTLTPRNGSAQPPSGQAILSGEDGEFSFNSVAPGPFQITISAAGFANGTVSGVLHARETYIAPTVTLKLAVLDTEVLVRVPPAEVAEAEIKAEEKQRVFGVVPNFYVSYVPDAVPLTAKQKWELAWKSTIDPVTFALTGLVAGVEQAQNAFSGYGQGAQGYAKRYGASYVDTATSTIIGSAILPALLKQDPRYFYKGSGSKRSRILYAIANAVICKGDNQRWQPNYSAILGGLASGGISNLYYPAKDRGAALVFENTAIGTGQTAIVNLLQEFVVRRFTPHVANAALDQH